MTRGYVSMRNEDGDQWLTEHGWQSGGTPYKDRKVVTQEEFDALVAGAKATRANDNPDNGFLGVYNAKFVPLLTPTGTQEEVLRKALRERRDPHAAWAAVMYNKPEADITLAERSAAKTANYYLLYNEAFLASVYDKK